MFDFFFVLIAANLNSIQRAIMLFMWMFEDHLSAGQKSQFVSFQLLIVRLIIASIDFHTRIFLLKCSKLLPAFRSQNRHKYVYLEIYIYIYVWIDVEQVHVWYKRC